MRKITLCAPSRIYFDSPSGRFSHTAMVDYFSEVVHPQQLLKDLKRLNIRMLFISGAEDICFIEGTKKLAANLKNAQLEILKNCGHVCSIEKYQEYNEKALRFLEMVHKENRRAALSKKRSAVTTV